MFDGNERPQIFDRVIGERLREKDAGVVDERVDRSKLILLATSCNFLRRFKLTYVAVDQREMVGS